MRFSNDQTLPLRLVRRSADPETVFALVPHLDPKSLTGWTAQIKNNELRFVFAYDDDRVGFALTIKDDEQQAFLDKADTIVPVPYDNFPSDLSEYGSMLLDKK